MDFKNYAEKEWLQWMDQLSDHDYVVIDNFLPRAILQNVLSFFNNYLGEFSKAGIGTDMKHQIRTNIRGDHTYWLNPYQHPELREVWELIDETKAALNTFCFLSLTGAEFHLVHYPKGARYEKHIDQFEHRKNRMISMVIYLNEKWSDEDGGKLELFLANGALKKVEPVACRCVLFKSASVPHAVAEVNKSRYSLTGWFLHRTGW